ncbi:MAG: hypothetical protein IPJ99_02580 [Betaproteobacteria bacterium]|nr:hypothetical protein [Betaproteobacteria bacterium]MBK8917857.1 hypothetical protein [Betaproteobacteria bacterium]MBK8917858.1 hypothetical protein [Betaproteobacteria bacterium]MBK8917859.1 hypothetical protein [Betaproteobacteria bacterium]
MALDIEQLLNLDLGFPGISFGYESWALESYLNVLEEQISHAQAQYRLRAERGLENEKCSLEYHEYGARLSEIDEAVDRQIPRFFRIGALVPIWGLFESFLTDFAIYVGKRENIGLAFRDVRANNFRNQIEKYFEGVLRIQLPWSEQERERLGQLQELRNFIAHRNGRLMDLPAGKEKEIKTLVAKIPGVEIEDSTIVVSPDYISEAAKLVFALVGRFSQQLADRYGGPIVPKTA